MLSKGFRFFINMLLHILSCPSNLSVLKFLPHIVQGAKSCSGPASSSVRGRKSACSSSLIGEFVLELLHPLFLKHWSQKDTYFLFRGRWFLYLTEILGFFRLFGRLLSWFLSSLDSSIWNPWNYGSSERDFGIKLFFFCLTIDTLLVGCLCFDPNSDYLLFRTAVSFTVGSGPSAFDSCFYSS